MMGTTTLFQCGVAAALATFGRLRKNYYGTMDIQWPAHLGQQENRAQDAQKGPPARPQARG